MAGGCCDLSFKHPAHVKKLADGNLEFAFNLYQACKEFNLGRGNLFFSPFSITTALAMTWMGARNDTAKQISDVLEFEMMGDEKTVRQAFHEVLRDLQAPGGGGSGANAGGQSSKPSSRARQYVLHTANRFYIDQSYEVLEDFSSNLSRTFMTEVGRPDFSKGDQEKTRSDINAWVQQITDNKVRNLVADNVLSNTTRIVLVNAIYFSGTWSTRFDPNKIRPGNFYRRKFERPVRITMMENKAAVPFVIDYDFKCKVVELPYVGNHLCMLVFLPFDVDGLAMLEKKFTPGLVKFLKKSMAKTKLTVVMPQLKINSSIPLSDVLMAMGITDLFYYDKADLSGITGTTELHFFEVMHNSFLDTNDGDRIVHHSSTSSVRAPKNAELHHRSQELAFVADHPFLFLIYDKPSKMTIFIGRFSDPSVIAVEPDPPDNV